MSSSTAAEGGLNAWRMAIRARLPDHPGKPPSIVPAASKRAQLDECPAHERSL
jgi:hypothetical protein